MPKYEVLIQTTITYSVTTIAKDEDSAWEKVRYENDNWKEIECDTFLYEVRENDNGS